MSVRGSIRRFQVAIEVVLGVLLVLAWAKVIVAIDGAVPRLP